MNNHPNNIIPLLEELQEFIPVMTPTEIGLIANGILQLTPQNLAHWQRLLNSWIRRRNAIILSIEQSYAKQR